MNINQIINVNYVNIDILRQKKKNVFIVVVKIMEDQGVMNVDMN